MIDARSSHPCVTALPLSLEVVGGQKRRSTNHPSYPAHAGYPVRRTVSVLSLTSRNTGSPLRGDDNRKYGTLAFHHARNHNSALPRSIPRQDRSNVRVAGAADIGHNGSIATERAFTMLASQRALFEMPRDICYLNSASFSPLPLRTQEAGRTAVGRKVTPWTLDAGFA